MRVDEVVGEYYKGFWEDDKGIYCIPDYLNGGESKRFYYEEGKTYSIAGGVELCERGFHFCKTIEAVLGYYPRLSNVVIHKVIVGGEVEFDDINDKGVCSKIKICEKITIPDKVYSYGIDDTTKCYEAYGTYNSEYIDSDRGCYRSYDVYKSDGVSNSRYVRFSEGVCNSHSIQKGQAIYHGDRTFDSNAVSMSSYIAHSDCIKDSHGVNLAYNVVKSIGVSNSSNISFSYYVSHCFNSECLLFCRAVSNNSYMIFNKKVSQKRYETVSKKMLKLFEYQKIHPEFLKDELNKFVVSRKAEYIAYTELFTNNIDLLKFIKRLKEFDYKIFEDITGIDEFHIKQILKKGAKNGTKN